MSKNLTRWGVLAMLLLLAMSLTSCGLGGTPPPDPVSLTFAFPDTDAAFYEALVTAFNEENPHITIELKPLNSGALNRVTPTEADVLIVSMYSSWERQQKGGVISLDPFFEQDSIFSLADFYPGALNMFQSEGKTWAIPAGMDMIIMFYNRDLLEFAGSPMPAVGWNWDDFVAIADAARDPGAETFGYVIDTAQHMDSIFFVYQHGGRVFDDLQNPTRTTFNEPLTVEAVSWYNDLVNTYNVAPTSEQARSAFGGSRPMDAYRGVLQGKVGMWIAMFSQRGGEFDGPVDWPMDWGMAPLPADAVFATQAEAEGLAISSAAADPQAAWQWVSFVSRQMPQRLAPARRSLAEGSDYERQVGEENAAVVRASIENAIMVSPQLMMSHGVEQAIGAYQAAVKQMLAEELSPEEAMEQAQQQAESMLGP